MSGIGPVANWFAAASTLLLLLFIILRWLTLGV